MNKILYTIRTDGDRLIEVSPQSGDWELAAERTVFKSPLWRVEITASEKGQMLSAYCFGERFYRRGARPGTLRLGEKPNGDPVASFAQDKILATLKERTGISAVIENDPNKRYLLPWSPLDDSTSRGIVMTDGYATREIELDELSGFSGSEHETQVEGATWSVIIRKDAKVKSTLVSKRRPLELAKELEEWLDGQGITSFNELLED